MLGVKVGFAAIKDVAGGHTLQPLLECTLSGNRRTYDPQEGLAPILFYALPDAKDTYADPVGVARQKLNADI